MRLLCDFTPSGGSLVRMAMRGMSHGDYQWYPYIHSFPVFKENLSHDSGGLVVVETSELQVSAKALISTGNWPPPRKAAIKLYRQSRTDYANLTTLFDGIGVKLETDGEVYISYKLYHPEFTAVVPDTTSFSGTLATELEDLCTNYLNLSINTSQAESPSPAIVYTVSGDDTRAIDIAAGMAAFRNHAFKIQDGTMYVFDLERAVGSSLLTTAVKAWPEFSVPHYRYTAGDREIAGAIAAGDEYSFGDAYHTNSTEIDSALADMRDYIEKDRMGIKLFLGDNTPTILSTLAYAYGGFGSGGELTTSGVIDSIIYDYNAGVAEIRIAGTQL